MDNTVLSLKFIFAVVGIFNPLIMLWRCKVDFDVFRVFCSKVVIASNND